MQLPNPFESALALLMYFLLVYIIIAGTWHFINTRLGRLSNPILRRSLIPLGITSVALGFLGFSNQYLVAMEAISIVDNISPALVAGAISDGGSYMVLGFLILAISGIFKYINQ